MRSDKLFKILIIPAFAAGFGFLCLIFWLLLELIALIGRLAT